MFNDWATADTTRPGGFWLAFPSSAWVRVLADRLNRKTHHTGLRKYTPTNQEGTKKPDSKHSRRVVNQPQTAPLFGRSRGAYERER